MSAPKIRAPKYINQILMNIKRKIDSKTIILQDFNILLTSMDRPSIQNQQGNSGLQWYIKPDGFN